MEEREFDQHVNMHLRIKGKNVQDTVQKIVAFVQEIMPKDEDFSWSLDTGQQLIKKPLLPASQPEKQKDKK